MDDFDGERFSSSALSSVPAARRVGGPAAVPEETGDSRIDGSREEQLLGPATAPQAVRVHGLDPEERDRVRQEVQLLAALEVAGVAAAPAVLELEDEGYVRETAPPVDRRRGRRSAETATPPTGERRAQARARETLDQLIDALHEREWVLGAPFGRGVGARADGSVLVLDLSGLRRDRSLSARQDDRRWVDSVLEDQDRTLRRRVHLERPQRAEDALPPAGPPSPEELGHRVEPAPVPVGSAVAPQPPLPMPRGPRRDAAQEPPTLAPVDDCRTGAGTEGPARPGAPEQVLSSVREVLHQPRLRRIAVLSGALVVLLGAAVLGTGAWWAQHRAGTNGDEDPPVAAATAEAAPRPAPRIQEPQMLVAELAGSRHAYVSGLSDQPASAPDSPALAEDERVREAYEGITVRAGGPVVHSAEVVQQPGSEGTAVLRAVTSMEELDLQEADGRSTTVPATDPVTIRLVLEWDGRQWRIVDAEQRAAVAEPDAP